MGSKATGVNHSGVKLYCSDKTDNFCNNIDTSSIKIFNYYLDELLEDSNNVNKNKITKVAIDCWKIAMMLVVL